MQAAEACFGAGCWADAAVAKAIAKATPAAGKILKTLFIPRLPEIAALVRFSAH
jgi:hypothetical protein